MRLLPTATTLTLCAAGALSQQRTEPPKPATVQQHEVRGNEDRADDERVEQHPKREGEPELTHAPQRTRRQ